MKITDVTVNIIREEVKNPPSDAMWTYDAGGQVITRVFTDEGITGYATTFFGRIKYGPEILKTLIDKEMAVELIGEDPFFSKRIRNKLWDAAHYHSVVGLPHFAISALDICLWDIVGKKFNMPTCSVLGGVRDRIPAYAMVGWYYDSENEYIKRCVDAVEEGYKAVKIKVGRYSIDDDIERIKLVQREVGKDVRVMVDANQIFDEVEALRRGRKYQELGVYWFEEPMKPQLMEGHARLAKALDIPIAIGENYYTKHEFYEAMKQGAIDIAQPDNRRAGGVTEWMEISAIADAMGIKVASHGGGPANVNMLCAIPNAIFLESGSLRKPNKMLKTQLKMVDGEILLPDAPGMGTELSQEFMQENNIV